MFSEGIEIIAGVVAALFLFAVALAWTSSSHFSDSAMKK